MPTEPAPEVALDVEVAGDLVHLVLANCGERAAFDVSTRFDRPVPGVDGRDLERLDAFTSLGLLRPGRELRALVGHAATLARNGPPPAFTAVVSFADAAGVRHRRTCRHDIAGLLGLPGARLGRSDHQGAGS